MTSLGAAARLAAGEYQRAQIRLAGQYAAYSAQLGRLWHAGKMSDDQYVRLHVALERAGHDTSAEAAARFLREFRELNNVSAGQVVANEFDEAAALTRTLSVVRSVEADPDTAETVIGRYAVGLNRAVLNAGRDTVAASAAAAHRTWRRVTDANPCAFCAMLATRDDYSSRDAALYVGGGSSRRKRHKRPLGSQYHDHCGCTAIEVLGEWEPTDADRAHQDLYDKAREALADEGVSPTAGNMVKKMRELGEGVVHDSHVSDSKRKKPGPKPKETSRASSRTSETKPKTATGGSGGGGRKPPELSISGGNDDRHPQRYEFQFHGSLGSRGRVDPPSVDELKRYLAPASNRWGEFSTEERKIATWLKEHLGMNLWSLKRRTGDGEVTPDAMLADLSGTMEFKTASTKAALVAQVRKGRKQSPRLGVWSGVTDPEEVQEATGTALRSYGDQLDELVVIFNDGASYVHWKHD